MKPGEPASKNALRDPRRGKLLKVLGRSMTSPMHLGVVAAAAGSSVWFHLWPLAALGGVAYAALVASDLTSADFWKRALAAKEEDAKPEGDGAVRDPTLRALAAQIRKARTELDAVVAENGRIAVQLVSVLAAASALDERADAVIKSADQLTAFLWRTDPEAIRREIAGLEERVTRAKDEGTRDQYLRTIATREEQLRAVLDIGAAVERAHANLMRINATYEGIAARVVRLSALDGGDMSSEFGDMNAELEDVNRDLESYEEVLRQLQPTGALS